MDDDEQRDEDDEHGYVELGDLDEGPYYQWDGKTIKSLIPI